VADFYEIVKSTVDKIAVDIAESLNIAFVEMDDTVNIDEMLASPDDMIVYQMVGMEEEPIDPLWSLHIQIGGKTTTDKANYDLAAIIGGIRQVVKKGDYVDVMDYSEAAAPTVKEGYIHFTEVAVDPQAFDGASGIRMLNINARTVRTNL
jgi:hypothetical protein